jgi:DNA-binding transcriptional regulator YiaG
MDWMLKQVCDFAESYFVFAALRKRLSLSAAEIAKLFDVALDGLYRWEIGKRKPTPFRRTALA